MIEGVIYPVPPESFLRRLFEFDPDLQLNWDPGHKVWSIWLKDGSSGRLSHVMNVVDHDGSFRPLDDRVFAILRANRYFAQHPEELNERLVNGIVDERQRQEKFVHDEFKHLAKDRYLNRKFDNVRELARSLPWKEWLKPKAMKDNSGNILYNARGEAIMYKPHETLIADSRKPTTIDD